MSEKAQDNWLSEFLTAPEEPHKKIKALPVKRIKTEGKPSSRKMLIKK
jgi:hypothetical protein